MKIIEFIKKYQLILFLFFLVVILIVLKLVYGDEDKNQISNLKPTPTEIKIPESTEISYEALNDGNPEYPLSKLLPYITDNFKIIGYDNPYTLVVRIKSGTKEEIEKEIKQWIKNYIPGDKDHKIIFTN